MTLAVVAGVLGLAWLSIKYAWWRPAASAGWPRLLMYHMIGPPRAGPTKSAPRPEPGLSPITFSAHAESHRPAPPPGHPTTVF